MTRSLDAPEINARVGIRPGARRSAPLPTVVPDQAAHRGHRTKSDLRESSANWGQFDSPRWGRRRTPWPTSRWSPLHYASYVPLAPFALVNVLIGVVLTSLDDARETERDEPQRKDSPASEDEARRLLLERIATARRALDDLEQDLVRSAVPNADVGEVTGGNGDSCYIAQSSSPRGAPWPTGWRSAVSTSRRWLVSAAA